MKKILTLALTLLITACQQAPSAYKPEPFAFESPNIAPININVAKIDLINHYQSPLKRPNVEQDFLVTPSSAIEKWVGNRMRAAGNQGTLQIIVHEAKVLESPLAKTQGVKGLFTDDQDARYDTKLAVTFRLFDGASTASRASGDVEVTRFITINEKATIFERQQKYHQMLEQAMADFDREANNRFRQYFLPYLR
jgi:hypothetical protein